MEKVFTINLGGVLFQIEDNGFAVLKAYLESIRLHFERSNEGLEIVNDIEQRLAEMLQDKVKSGKTIISITEVEEVINVMGKPQDFSDGNAIENNAPIFSPPLLKRKFFRDPDHRVLGGVCSGIVAYFDFEHIWLIRLLFLGSLFFVGAGAWVYILLWIVVPKAKSTSDRLEMKGEKVNIENMVKNISSSYKNINKSQIYSFLEVVASFSENIIKRIVRFFGKILGSLLIFISFLLGLILFVSGGSWSFNNATITTHGVSLKSLISSYIYTDLFHSNLLVIALLVLTGLPVLFLFVGGMKLMGSKIKIGTTGLIVAVICWSLAICVNVYLGLRIAKEFSSFSKTSQAVSLMPTNQVMDISYLTDFNAKGNNHFSLNNGASGGIILSDSGLYIKHVEIAIEKSLDNESKLIYEVSSKGNSVGDANSNAKSIQYKFAQVNNTLGLDPYFKISNGKMWRAQNVRFTLKIPVGKKIRFDHIIQELDLDLSDQQKADMGIFDGDDWSGSNHKLIGKTLEMKETGLVCVDC